MGSRHVCLLLALVATAAWPDDRAAPLATLSGRVVDSAGEPMPGVLLTLTNPPLSLAPATRSTDSERHSTFEPRQPGDGYEIAASVPDYAKVVAGPLQLKSASILRIVLT